MQLTITAPGRLALKLPLLLLLLLLGACDDPRSTSDPAPTAIEPTAKEAKEAARLNENGHDLLEKHWEPGVAVESFRRAVELDPQPAYLFDLASALYGTARYEEAGTLLALLLKDARTSEALREDGRQLLDQVHNAIEVSETSRYDVVLISPGADKLAVLKVARMLLGVDFEAAKRVVDDAPVPFEVDVTKARAEAIAARLETAGARVEVETAESRFDVMLVSPGANKLDVMKAVRDLLGIDLQSAKAIVDDSPTMVKTKLRRKEAERFEARLEAAGATVELK